MRFVAHRHCQAIVRGAAVLALLLVGGCLDPLPEQTLDCTNGSQCASGMCQNGECIPLNVNDAHAGDMSAIAPDAPGGDQSGSDTPTSDGTPPSCTDDASCLLQLGPIGPCSGAICDNGECSEVTLPAGATCTVGSICPIAGSCHGITCDTGDNIPCDDGDSCTFDACGPEGCSHKSEPDGTGCAGDELSCTDDQCLSGQCAHIVRVGNCLIGGVCYAKDEFHQDAPCKRCLPSSAAAQVAWTAVTNGPCDDGDWCTVADDCDLNATCAGLEVDCLDDNPCTSDDCDSVNGCVYLANQATCSDDDPCTLYGTCGDGKCGPGKLISCDDGNPCTSDKCVAGFGCVYTPNESPCTADTDPCTDDVCLGGACVAKPAASVCKIGGTCVGAGVKADANPCLVCDPATDSKSWTLLVGLKCDDGNACTVLDACTDGQCTGDVATCFDNNVCTADSCAPLSGCLFKAVSDNCDDDSACTLDDKCIAGKCLGTVLEPQDCADGNPCTDDGCADAAGCTHTPNDAPCNDGDKCTKGDICNAGKCIAGGVVCPCETNEDCNDGNPCTQDVCVKGVGCANPLADPKSACDDGNACTQADHCVNGLCKGGAIDCNDSNPCTKDGCVAESGCTKVSIQGSLCDDGNACTKGDLCLDGLCKGTPKNCDDGIACSDDWCDPGSGSCGHDDAAENTPCTDDGIACTLDQCIGGKCSHSAIKPEFCLIGGFCYSGGAPHAGKQCLGCLPLKDSQGWSVLNGNGCFDYDACTYETTCNAQGSCVGKPVNCGDGNPCTKDACNPQAAGGNGCIHLPLAGKCTDNSKCTTSDTCKDGSCLGESINCDDGNVCTVDSCLPTLGCVTKPAANGLPCADDGQPCTVDLCDKGACTHLPVDEWCLIGGQCVTAGAKAGGKPCMVCEPTLASLDWSFVAGELCDDGDPCTGADACADGGCQGDPDKACDDGNPCTDDNCNAANGCAHVANKGGCDDGDACTIGDSCSGGSCVAGTALKCPQDANATDCSVQVCKPDQGCAKVSSCGALHSCLGGLCLSKPNGAPPGPVAVPLAGVGASQPRNPTLAWQESHSGKLGAVPQLWLGAQTSACAPAVGAYSNVFVASFRPGQSLPTAHTLPTNQAGTAGKWCAAHPVLRPHPTSFDALAMSWLEGGHPSGACGFEATGGGPRVGLIGLGGAGVSLANGSPCAKAAAGGAPWPHRPAFTLLTGGTGSPPTPAQLGGLLFRPTNKGLLRYAGSAVTAWGGGDGKGLPVLSEGEATEQFDGSRPVALPWTTGSAMLAVSHMKPAQGWGAPVLTAGRFNDKGAAVGQRKVIATGVALSGAEPRYYGVEAAYHGEAKRIGVLLSGSVIDGDQVRTFLAFLRVDPDQAKVQSPKVAAWHSEPNAKGKGSFIRAYRVAPLPGGEFLVVWAAPGANVLKAMRVIPSSDSEFATKDLGAIAGNFVGHVDGPAVANSGGLSEIVIDPALSRYSVAWEGVGTVHLLTAALP